VLLRIGHGDERRHRAAHPVSARREAQLRDELIELTCEESLAVGVKSGRINIGHDVTDIVRHARWVSSEVLRDADNSDLRRQ